MFNTKKEFFKDKIKSVQCTIWEVEFKINKSRQVREGVRLDRDRAKEAINNIDAGLPSQKDEKAKAQMESDKAGLQENVSRYEKQMKMIDDQINGFQGDETHEPIVGLLEQLKSYTELMLMYKDWLGRI